MQHAHRARNFHFSINTRRTENFPFVGQVVRDLPPFCSLFANKNPKHRSLYRFPAINACYSDNLRALHGGTMAKARTVRNYSVAGLSGARLRSKKIIRVSMISAPCAPCSCIRGRNVGKSCSRHPEISSPREIALSHFYLTRLSRTVSNLRRYDTRRAISLTVRQ